MRKITLFLILSALTMFVGAQTPAFPGAEGGGMYTTGGRSGNVYFVTSLEDTSTGNSSTREGTLRWCLAQAGPRTIVFRTSGIIRLKAQLNIPANTTIAGQTAPGDGICIADHTTVLQGDNIIIRFIRFRMGDVTNVENDALWGRNRRNVIIDHCSMSWSTDECSSFYDNEDFTLQWSILSESLRVSVHGKGAHGYGGIWGGKKASFHHNLIAHHDSRNPRMCGSRYSNRPDLELVDFRNNVLYNWGSNSGYAGEGGSYNFVNNYYRPGAGSSNISRIFQPNADNGGNSQPAGVWGKFHVAGNVMHGSSTVTNDNWQGIHPNPSTKSKAELRSDTPFEVPFVTTHTAEVAFDKVLSLAGASFVRDAVDARVTNEARNGLAPMRASNGTTRAGLIDTQGDVGGWPDYNAQTPQTDANRDGIPDGWLEEHYPGKTALDKNADGYTYLEVYMNSLVQHIIDAKDLTSPNNGDNSTGEPIFCGEVPRDLVVPESVQNLITAGALSIASGRTDGCTEDGFTWRTSDVTFALPAKSRFKANFTANGSRTVYVTINGNEAAKTSYTISSTSCIPVTLNFDAGSANTLRIESYGSGGALSQFSMTELCITNFVSTSVKTTNEPIRNTLVIRDNKIIIEAPKVRLMAVSGVTMSVLRNVTEVDIQHLPQGVYLLVVEHYDGSRTTGKFVKR